MKYLIKVITILLLLMSILSCGSNNDNQVAFITDVRVDPVTIQLNQLASVKVDFEPSQRADDDEDGTAEILDSNVVIKLPVGVDYVTDSSEFDGSDVHGFEKRNPNIVEICDDGSRALTYQFSSGELTDNENSIRISVKPFEGSGNVIFYAMADSFIRVPCGIQSEDFDQLTILP